MFHKLIPPTHRIMQKCRKTYPGITQMSPAGCDRFAVGPWFSLWVVGRKSRQIYDGRHSIFFTFAPFQYEFFLLFRYLVKPIMVIEHFMRLFPHPTEFLSSILWRWESVRPSLLLTAHGVGGLAGAGGPSASEEWEIIRLGPCPIIDKARPTGKVRIVLDFPKTELNRTLISHKAHKSLGGSLISCNISFPNHHFIQMRWFLKIDIFFYFQLAIYQRFQFRGMRENVC